MNITETIIIEQLKRCYLPYVDLDLVSAKGLKHISITGSRVSLRIELGYPVEGIRPQLRTTIEKALLALPEITSLEISITAKIATHVTQNESLGIVGVKNIIAIASGKGGVGKSTTAVNLALALARAGGRVGILDADIHGPNQPHLLGVNQKPEWQEKGGLKPILAHGIQSMSIGYLIDANTPMIWRGPMLGKALQQLVRDTLWEDIDYLFIDLPPGTGDVQLTLVQKVPLSGAVIVTTPQDVALLDARKALEMFNKVNVPVLGVVENMSTHFCSVCGHEENIFGSGGGERMAQAYGVPLLGQLPLDIHIREDADAGNPSVIARPDTELAHRYLEIAYRLAGKLSLRSKSYAAKFPRVVVE